MHDQSGANVTRILTALEQVNATFRTHPHVSLTPDHFTGNRHNLLMCTLGPVDLLGFIGDQQTYQDLVPLSEEMSLGDVSFRVLTLEALITHKRALGRDKDTWVLALLERALEERDRG